MLASKNLPAQCLAGIWNMTTRMVLIASKCVIIWTERVGRSLRPWPGSWHFFVGSDQKSLRFRTETALILGI